MSDTLGLWDFAVYMMDIITCDVLVVGGGLAVASTIKNLLETKHDIEVCMAVKGTFGAVGQRGSNA